MTEMWAQPPVLCKPSWFTALLAGPFHQMKEALSRGQPIPTPG